MAGVPATRFGLVGDHVERGELLDIALLPELGLAAEVRHVLQGGVGH